VAEVEGDARTVIRLTINGRCHETTLAQLASCGFAGQMKPWHFQSYLMHTAVPRSAYTLDCEWEDQPGGSGTDVYHVECAQTNNQWAFLSPCFVEAE